MAEEDVIRHQMEDTRTSLTDKLETLEQQVVDTVQGATSAVNETVESIKDTVKDTVTTVKDSVQDTVSAVKDTVQGSVDTVKDFMDVGAHVDRHPWVMLGGSMLLGYCLGNMFGKRSEPSRMTESFAAEQPRSNGHRLSHSGKGAARENRRRESAGQGLLGSWLGELGPEIDKLKSLALGTLFGTAREMIIKAVPEHIGEQLKEVVDNVTTKLGGEPLPSSEWAGSPSSEQGEHDEERHQAKMGGQVGSTHRQGQKAMGQFDRR